MTAGLTSPAWRPPARGRVGTSEPAHRGVDDLVDRDVEQAPARRAALPLVGAFAELRARDRHVGRRPRAVAGGIGRSVEPDDGRADRGREMERPGIAGDHEPRARQQRHEIVERGRRRRHGRSVRGLARPHAREPLRRAPTARSTATPVRDRTAEASAPNRSAGQRLFGHAAPGLSATNAPASFKPSAARARAGHRGVDRRQRERRRLDARRRSPPPAPARDRRRVAPRQDRPSRCRRAPPAPREARRGRSRPPGARPRVAPAPPT